MYCSSVWYDCALSVVGVSERRVNAVGVFFLLVLYSWACLASCYSWCFISGCFARLWGPLVPLRWWVGTSGGADMPGLFRFALLVIYVICFYVRAAARSVLQHWVNWLHYRFVGHFRWSVGTSGGADTVGGFRLAIVERLMLFACLRAASRVVHHLWAFRF